MTRPPALVSAAAALTQASAAGPYFTIHSWSSGAGWRPLGALISDPVALAERAGHARGVLARRAGIAPQDVDERVAASTVFLGLASQLVSPMLGAAVIGGVVPRLAVADLWWRPADGGLWPLAAGPVEGTGVGQLSSDRELREAGEALSEGVHDLTAPLAASFGAVFRLSQQVLRGNVASALSGASALLAVAFPRRAWRAGHLTARVLAVGWLRGTGQYVQPDPAQARWSLARRSCCLLYRVPGAGICGDCVLRRETDRHL
ncbi:MAG: hypothetical protein JWL68_2373 [Actinomycetia bacterium]|nr:hypothetical protein [Actinomycetes bacterium]